MKELKGILRSDFCCKGHKIRIDFNKKISIFCVDFRAKRTIFGGLKKLLSPSKKQHNTA
ncbi:MAG: hypothetical protein RSA86_07655 [Christensenellaceae bacterium]